MDSKNQKLLYFIGPNFCVKSLAYESLKLLSEKYDVHCISEGPFIQSNIFQHHCVDFVREPSVLKDIRCLFQLIILVAKNRDSTKIVISTPKMSLLASIACRVNCKKYIYLHRGAVYQNFKGLKLKFYKFIDSMIIKRAENTTFISESLHKWVTNELNIKHLIHTRKYNSSKGVDLNKFFPASESNDCNQIVIGFCGRIGRDKGFDELIQLVENYSNRPDIKILIKGKIELHESDNILFTEYIKNNHIEYQDWDDQVVKFFQAINLLFFPSRREGFGNVLVEAAACGVPSLCYRIPGVIDAVVENKSGYLVDSHNDLFQRLDELLLNKNSILELAASSRSIAEKNFDQLEVLKDIHQSMKL